MTYPNINIEPELIKIKTRDDQNKNLKNQTEKHDHEVILKSLKSDNGPHKKKYKTCKKKKVVLFITEIIVGSASAVGSSTMGLIISWCWQYYFI